MRPCSSFSCAANAGIQLFAAAIKEAAYQEFYLKAEWRHRPPHVHGVAVGVALGLGVGDAATTLKLTVLERPLVPVPPVEPHGVATNV